METFVPFGYPQVLTHPVASDPTVTPAALVPASDGVPVMDGALDEVPEAIIVLDASARVIAWNRAASMITGFPASAALGGVCSFDGDTLTVDTEPADAPVVGLAPASAARRFWEFRVKDFGAPLEDVVAAVIPLGLAELGFYVHLVPRARLEAPGGPPPRSRGIEALTPREREILKLLAAGKTAKPIATQLALSVPTVRTHIQHILRKLGVHSCLEAAVVFLRSGGILALHLLVTLLLGLPEIA
jgi:DNA-binding CsgD family transcriptional regulator